LSGKHGKVIFKSHNFRSELVVTNGIVEVINSDCIFLELFTRWTRHIKKSIGNIPDLILRCCNGKVHFEIGTGQVFEHNTSPGRSLSKALDVAIWTSNVILGQWHVVRGSLLHEVKREEITSSQTVSSICEDNSDTIHFVQCDSIEGSNAQNISIEAETINLIDKLNCWSVLKIDAETGNSVNTSRLVPGVDKKEAFNKLDSFDIDDVSGDSGDDDWVTREERSQNDLTE